MHRKLEDIVIAQELMTRNPVSISPYARVREAVELLAAMDVRHLPVVNEANELVGMLSDRDLRAVQTPDLTSPTSDDKSLRALEVAVGSVMSSDVLSVDTEADVFEVIDLMLDHKVGAVPVVDADGALVGIISYIDVLRKATFEQ